MGEIVTGVTKSIVVEWIKWILEIGVKIPEKRKLEMCSEMENIATLLSHMAESFEKGEVPYNEGHQFEKLLNNPTKTLKKTMKKKWGVGELFEKQLEPLRYRMREMDWMIDGKNRKIFREGWNDQVMHWNRKKHLSLLTEDMERLAGDLKAYAVILRRT